VSLPRCGGVQQRGGAGEARTARHFSGGRSISADFEPSASFIASANATDAFERASAPRFSAETPLCCGLNRIRLTDGPPSTSSPHRRRTPSGQLCSRYCERQLEGEPGCGGSWSQLDGEDRTQCEDVLALKVRSRGGDLIARGKWRGCSATGHHPSKPAVACHAQIHRCRPCPRTASVTGQGHRHP